jgi:hypothetical protein
MSLKYGTLSRLWCPNCGEETIHPKGKCCRRGCNHQVEHADVTTPVMSGGRCLIPPRLRTHVARLLRENRNRTYGKVAEMTGVSLSSVKKIACEYMLSRK